MTTALFDGLRKATQNAHRELEDELDLLRQPLSQARFQTVLQRFYGFLRVWEPAVGRHEPWQPMTVGRRRLPLLKKDLEALGLGEAALAGVPECPAASDLVDTAGRALGSIYVMEGSTLGGKVITKALSAAPWLPPGGFSFFNPYGDETGARWREFVAFAETASPTATDEIVQGAVDTFRQLRLWLTPGLPA